MKVVVIGGSGHIGSYLIPKLVNAEHKVINITRGQSKPYKKDILWREVEQIILARDKGSTGDFESKIAALNADVVVDLINFTLESTIKMAEALNTASAISSGWPNRPIGQLV